MSGLTTPTTVEPVRRHLSARQADKAQRLVDAALVELRANGYDGLTVRNVASRAEVASATAYTYFASKDHLVTEVFWQRLQALPEVKSDRRRSASARVATVLHEIGLLIAEEPELAAASTTAILANDADVRRLRDRIGAAINDRLADALGDDADPSVVRALGLTVSGALLQAGMGYLDYVDLGDRMEEVAVLVLDGAR